VTKLKFGVPCSLLKDKIEDVEITCTTEEEAMAIAAGSWFAGKEPVVYMQNSGLCRCLDIILSLYKPYGIPLPKLMLSIRHYPEHHKFVGQITRNLLDLIEYENVEIVEQHEKN
jgi:phosphonopyruvate decarboxylase